MLRKKFILFLTSILLLTASLFSAPRELIGPWDFYWKKFVTYEEAKTIAPTCTVRLPSTWNSYPNIPEEDLKDVKLGRGSGTYHVKISNLKPDTVYAFKTYDLASTAIKIIINNEVVFQAGVPNENWKLTKMDQKMELATFTSDIYGSADILLYVSNRAYRKGGAWNAPVISEYREAAHNYNQTFALYSGIAGIVLSVMIFSLFLSIRKKDKTSIFLTLFTLSVLIRLSACDFPILKQYFPSISYALMLRLEFTPIVISPILYIYYLNSLDSNIFKKIPLKLFLYISLAFTGIIFFTPISISNWLVTAMQVFLLINVLLGLTGMIIYLVKYKNFIGIFSVTIITVIFLCCLDDILITKQSGFRVFGSMLLPFSFAIFCLCQTVILAVIQTRNDKKVFELYDFLSTTNKAYNRFVPNQFLQLFNKKDITELNIGDKVTTDMMILSADIRDFTATSEKLSGMQVFDLLNSYFAAISPVIYKHGGIIEKYLGDGIIVFFQKDYAEALNCAIEMQETMITLREQFQAKGLPELKIGIGVHFGKILVGTAGDASRMSEVSISQELSVLQHVESSTKRYHKSIVVTREALEAASDELRPQGKKFNFYGHKIKEAIGRDIYYIYNDNIRSDL